MREESPEFSVADSGECQYISVGLKAWTASDGYWGVYTDLLKGLQKRLLELGIELAVPQQEIRVHGSQSDKIVAKQTLMNLEEH